MEVTSASDVISVNSDLTNRIPDKSWMLYLLELFDVQGIPVELNLIAQFNDVDNFWAIFGGVNRYKFTSVLPRVGHSYLRQIELDESKRAISYIVRDQGTGESEHFEFPVSQSFSFMASAQFTGVEWWSRISDYPFPVRYETEISSILFRNKAEWSAYDLFVPDYDRPGLGYPIDFRPGIRNGAIAYTIGNGQTVGGLSISAARP